MAYDTKTPTGSTYATLTEAYDFLNKELFNGKLGTCLITMQRRNHSRGYFCADRFETRDKNDAHVHEIALNPSAFSDRTDEDIISTLLHEMVHLWQQENGKPPRRNYHNREWADMMEAVGLMPSDTGEPGGSRTGQSMTHFIIDNGKYRKTIAPFLEQHKLYYQDRPTLPTLKKAKNKTKYTCPTCGVNVWGKDNMSIICGDDRAKMEVNE